MVHIKTLTTLFTPYLQQGNQSTTINRKKKDKLKVIEIFAVFCHFKESDRLPILHILTKFYEIQLGSVYIILLTDCGLSWADFFFRFGKILLHSNQTAVYMLIFALQRQSKCHISAVVMLCSSRRLRNSSWRLTNWEGEMLLVFTRTNTAAADPQSMKPYSCVCLRVCGGSLFVSVYVWDQTCCTMQWGALTVFKRTSLTTSFRRIRGRKGQKHRQSRPRMLSASADTNPLLSLSDRWGLVERRPSEEPTHRWSHSLKKTHEPSSDFVVFVCVCVRVWEFYPV